MSRPTSSYVGAVISVALLAVSACDRATHLETISVRGPRPI
jgi:hypothetical protein